uniref:Putative secreted protein n=1 Tax=Ixodes ricinus TaxID=34613 RepID=A0A6B0U985_IXORI
MLPFRVQLIHGAFFLAICMTETVLLTNIHDKSTLIADVLLTSTVGLDGTSAHVDTIAVATQPRSFFPQPWLLRTAPTFTRKCVSGSW